MIFYKYKYLTSSRLLVFFVGSNKNKNKKAEPHIFSSLFSNSTLVSSQETSDFYSTEKSIFINGNYSFFHPEKINNRPDHIPNSLKEL